MTSCFRRTCAAAFMVAGGLALSGCATGYLLEHRVQAFSSFTAAPASASYRFERLPSQQADPLQPTIELLADPALMRAGLRRDDAGGQYAVQVSARVQRVLSPYADPWDAFGGSFGFGWGRHGRHFGIGAGLPRLDQPWFQREVRVIIRELASNRVVFESNAASDGPWTDNNAVLPVMFQAAMQGFPNPPQGVRRVDIHVGGPGAAQK